MPRHPEAGYPWTRDITTHLPTWSPSQAAGLASWVVGLVVTRSSPARAG
jgi:hypothetical protein